LQVDSVLADDPNLVRLSPIAAGDLLQQTGCRFAALAGFVGGVRAEEHGLDPGPHRRQLALHAQMQGVELRHIEAPTPEAGLVGGQRHVPAAPVELRNRLQHAGLGLPVLERDKCILALGMEGPDPIQDGQLHRCESQQT